MVEAKNTIVVIPVYNCHRYLSDAVTSVLNQPYKGIQIILVDDGSTDGSSELCDTLSAQHECVSVIHQKNSGVSAARNAGIEYALSLCQGQEEISYLAFLDADDAWIANFFSENVVSTLSKGFDVVGYSHCETDERLNVIRSVKNSNTEVCIYGGADSIWCHGQRHLGCMFFKIHLLQEKEIRFPVGLKYNEDEIFKVYVECLCATMRFESTLMYLYRIHSALAVHNLDSSILERYQTWMSAWRYVDDTLLSKYGITTNIGKIMSDAYFVEMCIVYTQSLQPLRPLRMCIRQYTDIGYFSLTTKENIPNWLQQDFVLLKKHRIIFYMKHRTFGLLKAVKHLFKKVQGKQL